MQSICSNTVSLPHSHSSSHLENSIYITLFLSYFEDFVPQQQIIPNWHFPTALNEPNTRRLTSICQDRITILSGLERHKRNKKLCKQPQSCLGKTRWTLPTVCKWIWFSSKQVWTTVNITYVHITVNWKGQNNTPVYSLVYSPEGFTLTRANCAGGPGSQGCMTGTD